MCRSIRTWMCGSTCSRNRYPQNTYTALKASCRLWTRGLRIFDSPCCEEAAYGLNLNHVECVLSSQSEYIMCLCASLHSVGGGGSLAQEGDADPQQQQQGRATGRPQEARTARQATAHGDVRGTHTHTQHTHKAKHTRLGLYALLTLCGDVGSILLRLPAGRFDSCSLRCYLCIV